MRYRTATLLVGVAAVIGLARVGTVQAATSAEIAASPDACHDLSWWAERGLIERGDVETVLAKVWCPTPQYPRTAVELAHGRAGCVDITWAARQELITLAQWEWLDREHPECRPPAPRSPLERAGTAAAAGDWAEVVRQAADAYGLSAGPLLALADCESGLNPDAYNSGSGAAGLFQHLDVYWPSRAAAAGFDGASPFDGVANAFVSAKMISEGGRDHWSC